MEKRTIYLIIAITLAILIISSAIFFSYPTEQNNSSLCVSDEDCIKTQTSCCPCSSGGQESCVLKSEQEIYANQLKNCSTRTLCATVYNCNQAICSCIKGRCIEKAE